MANLSNLNNIGNNVNFNSNNASSIGNLWGNNNANKQGMSQDQMYQMYRMMQAQNANQNEQNQIFQNIGTIAGKLWSDAKARENDGLYKGAIVMGSGKTDKENYDALHSPDLTASGVDVLGSLTNGKTSALGQMIAQNPELVISLIGG